MTVNLGLLVVVGVLGATGVYLLMERSLVRMLLGLMLVGNGVNVLIVILAGGPGKPPVRGAESLGSTTEADPLAQGMVLTAIVITMGVAAFILALTYRLFVINRQDDDLEDDSEDVKLREATLRDSSERDRSADPVTGAPTVGGDLFDEDGNPLTPEEFVAAHLGVIETDLMPADAAILDHLPSASPDEMPDDEPRSGDDTDGPGERTAADGRSTVDQSVDVSESEQTPAVETPHADSGDGDDDDVILQDPNIDLNLDDPTEDIDDEDLDEEEVLRLTLEGPDSLPEDDTDHDVVDEDPFDDDLPDGGQS
ncbi:Na(+)/H(+) antiporter subunit C [Gordonia hirsuta DSM 44140 = NBRC 16056]|uniref:Na(+)/H(+) antiporter subunit C n=1 Tax=Gordonia hirsuta DSM 44140 = NBRC 16056 TaxID=1121927 RepID=L7LAF5_9ACTN|nr:Na(+)/H(+) antiporter subunit C [Gordonia hirsuta DSM 44140 = NBRC 16056]